MNLAFIGAGHLAWHLAPELENSGHSVKWLVGRDRKNLESLAGRLYDPIIKQDLDFSNEKVQVIFIATPDSVIRDIASEIILPDECLLVHCSASQPMGVLDPSASPETGVLYPLQTFTKGYKIEFNDLPVFIEGSSEQSTGMLVKMAKGISREVYLLDSDRRKKLHLAATFISNFTNHMLHVSQELTGKFELDFDLLWPLLKTTIQKAMELGPSNAQTGPAIRKDYDTMDAHIELLKDDPDLEEIYSLLSRHIIKMGEKK